MSFSQLSEIFPSSSAEEIQNALLTAKGSLERAAAILVDLQSSERPKKKLKLGLDAWIGITKKEKERKPSVMKAVKGNLSNGQSSNSGNSKSIFDLKPPPPALSPAPSNKTIELNTPSEVWNATGSLCTLIENILPNQLALRLFLSSVESSKTWEKNRFYLFDRFVESPHTTAFFVPQPSTSSATSTAPATSTSTELSDRGVEEAAKFWYNGEKRDAMYFNSDMEQARELIGERVRRELSGREKHSLEWGGDWIPNVSAANCYRGQNESVGWHTDVLSYLGPRPTIASLSLGVRRKFLLKSSSNQNITLSIALPHNSLLIMHSGVQELYKHSVPTAKAIDLFKIPASLSSNDEFSELRNHRWNERINFTFRFYRPDFAPLVDSSAKSAGTPICSCGIPASLRPDAKGKVKARAEENGATDSPEMLYFWVCNNGQERTSCSFFQLLDYEKERRGIFFGK